MVQTDAWVTLMKIPLKRLSEQNNIPFLMLIDNICMIEYKIGLLLESISSLYHSKADIEENFDQSNTCVDSQLCQFPV